MPYGMIGEGKKAAWGERKLRGVVFYEVTLPVSGWFAGRRRRRLWFRLMQSGVRKCIMPEKWHREAAAYGITPLDTVLLRRALLPRLLPPLEGKTVALRAVYADAAVVEVAHLLARTARYVTLDIDCGGETLGRQLWRDYGIGGSPGHPAALTVDFTDTVPGALSLGRAGELWCRIDGQILPETVAAALFLAGAVKKEDIEINSVPFNA